jgi:hypothetical protein
MKKKYNTEEERKEARRLSAKKYRNKNINKLKEKTKEYRDNNKEKVNEATRKWREENPDKIKNYSKDYRKKNLDEITKKIKIWKSENKDKINNNERKRRANDKLYKLSRNIKSLIWSSFNKKGYTKKSRTHHILNCSFDEFKQHLESKFLPWMNWDNYGLYNGELNHGWDIDHIIPMSSAINEEDVIRLNHYTNLQPLCSYINRYIKKDNY